MSLDQVRSVADAVLYEGYLLYPYRASSSKNQCRWQFGVLGPPGACASGLGEEASLQVQCLLAGKPVSGTSTGPGTVTVHLRFLQLQVRQVERLEPDGEYEPVEQLVVDGLSVLSWDEAVEREFTLPQRSLLDPAEDLLEVPAGADTEVLTDASGAAVGRIVRRRWPLTARLRTDPTVDDGLVRLTVSVRNENPVPAVDKDAAIRTSLIGAHLLLQAHGADFVSLLEPSDEAVAAAARCKQHRCWPVLAGAPGSTDVVLGAPIILYDYPQIAEQSTGALFDATEIDEILTLRVMTMTEDEKAEARATDPRAAAIIDRCDEMSDADLQRLHGVLRDPHADDPHTSAPAEPFVDLRDIEPPGFDTGDVPWWDPEADAAVRPETDAVLIDGVQVARGSLVRVHPSRRADAQDIFFADRVARVTAVLADVEGEVHVAVVLVDDPASDLHDWYGRYFYFAPDELEPLPGGLQHNDPVPQPEHREESR